MAKQSAFDEERKKSDITKQNKMRHKGKQRRDTREQNFEDKTRKVLRIQNYMIAYEQKN